MYILNAKRAVSNLEQVTRDTILRTREHELTPNRTRLRCFSEDSNHCFERR